MGVVWERLIREDLEALTPYAPGLRASEVRDRSGRSRILKLSSNEHPRGPFPQAVAAISSIAPYLNRYPDGAARALRRRLAEHLAVPVENLVVGNGSNELLNIIVQAVVRPRDEVVFAWPSFIVYPLACKAFGAKEVRVPLRDDTHDLEAMLAAISDRTRLLFLCNPNNPTGTIYRREAFAYFMERVPEHVLVVADEAYHEFVTDSDNPDALEWFDGNRALAVTRTFSKVYSLAGLRVGYAAVPERLAEAVDKLRAPFNVNSIAQAAAYYSLGDQTEVGRRRAENADVLVRMCAVFDELSLTYAPSHANFVWVHTQRGHELFDALLTEGVIVRDFDGAALRVGVPAAEDLGVVAAAFRAAAEHLGGF